MFRPEARMTSAIAESSKPLRSNIGRILFSAFAWTCPMCAAWGGVQIYDAASLADLSLEQLSNLEITSVSRRPESLSGATASVFVITNDDIRRSGANTLPEALRLAPNLQVARLGSASYAISSRGFNNALGNKLLVLIDGRTVYTPLNSGVFWDQQEVMLEDVERIEVISGAGGTTWGTNAVNGVINVITRSASKTQGALLAAGAGDPEIANAFRYGGKLGTDGSYRVYAKQYSHNDDSEIKAQGYDWQRGQGGFRFDWDGDANDFTLQGDYYEGKSEEREQPIAPGFSLFGDTRVSGMNMLGRWDRRFDNGQNLRVQAYYDRAEREDELAFQDVMEVFDIELQHGVPFGRHSLLWGAGYRQAEDDTEPGLLVSFVPEERKLHWLNAFVQGKFNLAENVELTAGTRFERNDYTGWEILPSVRVGWKPSPSQLLWGAVSRAVRAPSRIDREFFFGFPGVTIIAGGPDFRSEIAIVSEIGYRAQPTENFSFSVTAFHHDYEYLRSGADPDVVGVPVFVQNNIQGSVRGLEAWATWQVARSWRLSVGLNLLSEDLEQDPFPPDPDGLRNLGNNPPQQYLLRSSWDISSAWEFDAMLRRVGELPDPAIEAYTAVDVRLAWKPRRDLELSLAAQNLFDPGHIEYVDTGLFAVPTEIERRVFLKLLWRM
jgi:iron complex outermembrane recepter protein